MPAATRREHARIREEIRLLDAGTLGTAPLTDAERAYVQRSNARIRRLLDRGQHPVQTQRASERRLFQVLHPRDAAGRFITRRKVRERARV